MSVLQEVGFPSEAISAGLETGVAVIGFTLNTDGTKSGVQVLRSSHEVFAKYGLSFIQRLECSKPSEAVQLALPIYFKLR